MDELRESAEGRFHKIPAVITILYILLILGAISPFFWGSSGTIDKDPAGSALLPHSVPEEYKFMYTWVKDSLPGFKTLIFPGKIPFPTTSSKHPAIYGHYYNHPPLLEFSDYFWVKAYGHTGVFSRELTDEFGRILGLANIRNIAVAPKWDPMWGIMPNDRRENIIKILDTQKGLRRQEAAQFLSKITGDKKHGKLVYTEEDVIWLKQKLQKELLGTNEPSDDLYLYQNKFALPLIYGAVNGILIVGGLDALLQAVALGIDFSKWALFFASHLCDRNIEVADAVDTIIFSGRSLDDLILASVGEEYRIDLWDFAEFATQGRPTEQRPYDYYKDERKSQWLRFFSSYWTSHLGDITESKKGLVQVAGADLENPLKVRIDVSRAGFHEIWLRAGVGYNALDTAEYGGLSIYIDNVLLEYINLQVPGSAGLRWIKIADANLTEGEHTITIFNKGAIATLDQLVIIPSEEIKGVESKVKDVISNKKLLFLCEAEKNLISGNEWSRVHIAGSSEGYVLETFRQFSSLSWPFEVPVNGHYKCACRVSSSIEPGEGEVIISIDGKKIRAELRKGVHGIRTYWVKSEPVFLESGWHEISMYKVGHGRLTVDLLAVHNGEESIENILVAKGPVSPLTWSRESSTKYIVELKRPKPKFVVFNYNYHPAWKGLLGEDILASCQVNGWANGFLLDSDSDDRELTIIFGIQKYALLGFYISAMFFLLVIGYLFLTSELIKSTILKWRK